MTNKLIVGSEEWCSLPGLGLPAIKARVDSGAATSSLHAFNIVPFQRDGELWISFEVHPLQNDRSVVVRHEAPVLEQRSVRNTSGISENRYVIREELVLGEQRWPIELTLTNRDAMGYRMLLGREAMVGRVLVDPEGAINWVTLNRPSWKRCMRPCAPNARGFVLLCWLRIQSSKAIVDCWRRVRSAVTAWNFSTSSSATCGLIHRTPRCITGAAMCTAHHLDQILGVERRTGKTGDRHAQPMAHKQL